MVGCNLPKLPATSLPNSPAWRNLANVVSLKAWQAWVEPDFHFSLFAMLYFLLSEQMSIQSLSREIPLVTVSLACYLAWGVLVNDLCDLPYDQISGKRRAIFQVPKWQLYGFLILLPVFGYTGVAFLGRVDFGMLYSLAYILAAFYSAEPVRLKRRGFHGVWSDAVIERFVPTLLIVVYFRRLGGDALLLLALSFVSQLEVILWHQMTDYEADMTTNTRTYVVKVGLAHARRVLNSYVRPLSAILIAVVALVVALQVPVFTAVLVALVPGYILMGRAVRSRLVVPEDPQRPLYSSYLSVCVQTIFPMFLATVLVFAAPQLVFLSILTLASQFRSVRDYAARPLNRLLKLVTWA